MSATASRTCQECKRPATRGNRVCFSKHDKRYLHGGCRGPNHKRRNRRNDMTMKLWYAVRKTNSPAAARRATDEFFATMGRRRPRSEEREAVEA